MEFTPDGVLSSAYSYVRSVFYSSTFLGQFGGPRNSIFELSFETQSLEIALVESKITLLVIFKDFLSNGVNKMTVWSNLDQENTKKIPSESDYGRHV